MDTNVTLPIVSVIMPAYNAEKYIEESINSVLEQTFTNWELIIVDDGSRDATGSIVKEYAKKDHRIIYYFQENKRLGAARNAGFRLAKGKFIAFLDSDDLWFPDKLKKQIEIIEYKQVDLVFTDGYNFDKLTKQLYSYETISGFYSGEEMYKIEFEANKIAILSVMMKSDWIKKIGYQSEEIEIFGCEDYDYWLRIAKNGATFFGMEEKLFKYRVHEEGMSRNIGLMKLALFNALYRNIDYRILERDFIYKKFSNMMEDNLSFLLKNNKLKLALDEIKKVNTIKFKINHLIAYFILLLNVKPFFGYLGYIFYPGRILLKKSKSTMN